VADGHKINRKSTQRDSSWTVTTSGDSENEGAFLATAEPNEYRVKYPLSIVGED